MTVTGHIKENEMQSFCAGDLSASETIRCAEHLEVCPECSRVFSDVSTNRRASTSRNMLFSPETLIIGHHLDYEEISSYLDRSVSKERAEVIKVHLDLCRECSKDLLSLVEFRKSIESEIRGQYPNQGVLNRLVSYFGQFRYFNPVHVFGVITVTISLALLVVLASRWPGSSEIWLTKKTENQTQEARGGEFETIYDKGKQFTVRFQGDRITINDFAPELLEDAVKIIREVRSGRPNPRGSSSPQGESAGQGESRDVQQAAGKYLTHFELGFYYLKHGLVDRASGEFQQLRAINPESTLLEKICRRYLPNGR